MTKQELLDLLTAERFAPRPERPAHNDDGPTAQVEQAAREADVVWLHERRSA